MGVELEIYAMGEPTGAMLLIEPGSVQDVQELPGKPRASKVIFKDGKGPGKARKEVTFALTSQLKR